jgi:hypothetical protein
MVKKLMAMRMVTIFVALVVCGMFFPDLARGEDLSSDKGFIAKFEDLQLNEKSEPFPVVITNESGKTLKLLPQFKSDGNCEFGFAYDGPWLSAGVAPGESLFVSFTYTPSNYDECGATLDILNMLDMAILATIKVIGVLEEPGEEPRTFGEIVIGGFNTGVLDREDEDGELISDMIRECKETATNIGSAQRCISRLTKHLMWHDKLSREERQALMNTAWRSAMSEVMQKMKAAKSSGKRDRRCSRFWWRNFHHHWRH